MKSTSSEMYVIKEFSVRDSPNGNYKRDSKIKSSFGPQRRFNLGAVYQDDSVTRGSMRKIVVFQLNVIGKGKRGSAKFTPEMITAGTFYNHSCTLLINLECITAKINESPKPNQQLPA